MTQTKAQRDATLQEVKMYQSNGWDIKEETPEFFLLSRNTATGGGHVLVFFLTFWFTLGLGNLAYQLLSNKTKKIIK